MSETAYASAIDAHYTREWAAPIDRVRWPKGRIHELPPDFRVLVIPRSTEIMAYATRCMSQPEDDERLELHLFTRRGTARSVPAERDSLVELLTVVAHYHRTGQRLGLGHTVNFGRPWLEGSGCSYGLISLPYLDGPDLEWSEAPRIRFLWLIPITEAELQYKKASGLEALEQKFEELQFDYLDPLRPSVV
jgi:hypothetical protein